jgi:hypothetical protein
MSEHKTLGKQLAETHEEHLKDFHHEAGEVVNAFGPKYMEELKSTAQNHIHLGTKFYIQVISKHLIFAPTRGMQLLFVARLSKPTMNATEDVWSVDPGTGNIELEWSLPHKLEMSNILRNGKVMAPKLINDIQKYLAETNQKLRNSMA